MDYQEFAQMGQKARRETEDFINYHIHDKKKEWPVICSPALTTEGTAQTEPSAMDSHTKTAARLPYPLSARVQVDLPKEDGFC